MSIAVKRISRHNLTWCRVVNCEVALFPAMTSGFFHRFLKLFRNIYFKIQLHYCDIFCRVDKIHRLMFFSNTQSLPGDQ